MSNNKKLEDLKAVCEAATSGPWRQSKSLVIQTKHATRDIWTIADCQHNAIDDAAYIATFNPQLVSALIDEVMAARKVLCFRPDYYPKFTCDLDDADHVEARERVDALIGELE